MDRKLSKPQKKIFSTLDKLVRASVGKYLIDADWTESEAALWKEIFKKDFRSDAGNYCLNFMFGSRHKMLLRNYLKFKSVRLFEDRSILIGSVIDGSIYKNIQMLNAFQYRKDKAELMVFYYDNQAFFDGEPETPPEPIKYNSVRIQESLFTLSSV